MRMKRVVAGIAVMLAMLASITGSAWALEADELALVVNRNAPEGRILAEFYAQQRGVPPGRIIALNLPRQEEMSFERYGPDVVAPVREFLRQNQLEKQVKCLVTFYGVPLRLGNKPISKAERVELMQLEQRAAQLREQVEEAVRAAEEQAKALDEHFAGPATNPGTRPGTQSAAHLSGNPAERATAALRVVLEKLGQLPVAQRKEPTKNFATVLERLGGPKALVEQFGAAQLADPALGDQDKARWRELIQRDQQARQEIVQLQSQAQDATTRSRLRELMEQNQGLFGLLRQVQLQIELLRSDESGAALDNELALLWWDNYPRSRWLGNPLHYSASSAPAHPAMMVMRLDAPQAGMVRQLIVASLKAEHDGLQGKIVLDSRGLAASDKPGNGSSYGRYDQTLRDLAELVRTKTKLQLVWDQRSEVLPANSVQNVALYCGWYSLRHYVPFGTFNIGAVGYHVASLELVSLHNEEDKGWVHGLLGDGMVATMGAVAEPYLHSFPPADDFFPLLMTGKLTLAEVYWKTTPLSSWMLDCIGDPLYTPYKNDPALKVEDLPPRLRRAVAPASQPASQPKSSATEDFHNTP